MICNALVKTNFDYCCPLRDNCGGCYKDKLQRLQSRASTGSAVEIRSDDVLIMLRWESLDHIRNYIKSIYVYKIINDLAAPFKTIISLSVYTARTE